MDVDFWAARVHSAKHFSAPLHASRLHSGLPFMCSKSGERCNWTFYGATCKLLKVAAIHSCQRGKSRNGWNAWRQQRVSCSEKWGRLGMKSTEENLGRLASGLVVQQCLERSCIEGDGKPHMNLRLIRYSHHLSAAYLLSNLKALSKMMVQSPMSRSLVMRKAPTRLCIAKRKTKRKGRGKHLCKS